MGYGPKRLAEIEAARKARKEEKARLKKEKEKEKKRLKRIERQKKLKKKRNRIAYLKRRNAELKRRKELGDEYGYYSVYIVKNKKKIRYVGSSWWKIRAYNIYNDAIERNRQKTVFPRTIETNRKNGAHEARDVKYEILLVKKIKEGDNAIASFRDENGKFVNNVVTDWKDHIIIEKNNWYVEETFGIYGFHPRKEKKTYSYILNNLLLSNEDIGDEMRRILVYKNKVIIQYLEDFDFVTCYDNEQAKALYDMLQKDITKLKKKYIVFMGETTSKKWIDRLEGKTGWNRQSIFHKTTAY